MRSSFNIIRSLSNWSIMLMLGVVLLLSQTAVAAPGDIHTLSGGVALDSPNGILVTQSGDIYLADMFNHRVVKIGANGALSTVAGNGVRGAAGDGGPAAAANLDGPVNIAMDNVGTLYIADIPTAAGWSSPGIRRVRKVDANGSISTVIAGTGALGGNACTRLATDTYFNDTLRQVLLDPSGRLHIIANSLWRLEDNGTLTNRSDAACGNGWLPPGFMTGYFDASSGAFIYWDADTQLIFSTFDFQTSTIAGINVGSSPVAYLSGDIYNGNIFVAKPQEHKVYQVRSPSTTIVLAGSGTSGYSGDGGYSMEAQLNGPAGASVDQWGKVYIVDRGNNAVRKVEPDLFITTVAGAPDASASSPAPSVPIRTPRGVFTDTSGNIYVADTYNHRIRKIDPTGMITNIAGNGYGDYCGDGGSAVDACLFYPSAVFADPSGNVYIADTMNDRIRKVDTSGIISTIVGTGVSGYSGDGGSVANAMLNGPTGVAVNGWGDLFFSDSGNNAVRTIDNAGNLSTRANVSNPRGMAVGAQDDLYIASRGEGVIKIVGGGSPGALGSCNDATGVAVDFFGNVYAACPSDNIIMQITSGGSPVVVAGTGSPGFSGDGGPAIGAALSSPWAVSTEPYGALSVADAGNDRVRGRESNYPDYVPPMTAASPHGGEYTAPVSVTLTCGDGMGVGCATTYYCIGSGCSPTTYYDQFGPSLEIAVPNVLRFYSRDVNGNSETVREANYSVPGPTGWTIHSVMPGASSNIDWYAGLHALLSPNSYVRISGNYFLVEASSSGSWNDGVIFNSAFLRDCDQVTGAPLGTYPDLTAMVGQTIEYFSTWPVPTPPGWRVHSIGVVAPVMIDWYAGQHGPLAYGTYVRIGSTFYFVAGSSPGSWNDGWGSPKVYYNNAMLQVCNQMTGQPLTDGNGAPLLADLTGTEGQTIAAYQAWGVPYPAIMINGNKEIAYSRNASLSLSCNDSDKGCVEMQFSNDNGAWTTPEPFAETKIWSLSAGDGIKVVSVKFKNSDAVWSSAYDDTISLQYVPPAPSAKAMIISKNGRSSTFVLHADPNAEETHTYTITQFPAHGTATIDAATGRLQYAPNSGYTGNDSITVEVLDQTGLWGQVIVPVLVAPEWASFAPGGNYSLAVRGDGTLWAWGVNNKGQFGIGTTDTNPHSAPIRVGTDSDWAAVSSHEGQTSVALKQDGSLWAWGNNDNGQVGDNTLVDKSTPVQIGSDTDWVAISSGSKHTVALKQNGSLWTWGDNYYGQLGDSTVWDRSVPTRVGADSDWIAVSAGAWHTVVLKADGSLWAWGLNYFGELGDGTNISKQVPTRVGTDTGWVEVSAGARHSLALRADGSLWAWGENSMYQLGNGAGTDTNVPVRVGSDADWLSAKTAGYSSVALKKDGSIWNWGSVAFLLTRVGTSADWIALEMSNHFMVQKSDGSLWTWGTNEYGQLGDGSTSYTSSPVPLAGPHPLFLQITGSGGGSVISSPAGISCGVDCNESYSSGAVVTLTATSSDGSIFSSWSGACTGTGSACDVTMDAAKYVTAEFSIISDTTPPTGTIVINNGTALTRKSDVTCALTCNDGTGTGCAQMQFSNDGLAWSSPESFASSKIWTLSSGDGQKTVSVKFKDNIGNWSLAYDASISLDTTAPLVTITSPAAGMTSSKTALLTYTVSDGTVVVKVDGNVVSKASGTTLDPMDDGTHTVRVESVDAAGNIGVAEVSFTIDTTAPVVSISSPVAGVTNNTDPLLTFTADDGIVIVKVDGVVVQKVSGDTLNPLVPGAHSVVVEATDAAGNTGFAEVNFTIQTAVPVAIEKSRISAGSSHTVVLRSDGTLWAWGYNYFGQLGDTTTVNKRSPVQIGTDTDWVGVSAGGFHTVALKADGTLWAWGHNNYGQLGINTTVDAYSPVRIGTDADWVGVTAGGSHTVALKADGTLWAWGYNHYGQLGDDSTVNKISPVKIGNDASWVSLSAGGDFTVALKSDGTLWAWGMNWGQLGDGTKVDKHSPVQIGSETTWVKIAAGGYHTLAIKSDGTLWTWGYNYYGQLGDSSTSEKLSPGQLGNDAGWVLIAAGSDFSMAVNSDNMFYTWGHNNYGQLGNGETVDRHEPYLIGIYAPEANGLVSMDAGGGHSLILTAMGGLSSWGRNYYGQVGLGIVSDNVLSAYQILDKVVKNGAVSINKGVSYVHDASVTVDYMVSDASGVSEMQFSNDGTSWSAPEPYETTKDWTLIPGDGPKTVYTKFKDNAGYWSEVYTVSVVLDTATPVVSISSPAAGGLYNHTPLLHYTILDGASVLTVIVKVDGVRVFNNLGEGPNGLPDGPHVVRVEATDPAGNVGFAEATLTIDTIAPAVTITSPAIGVSNVNIPALTYSVDDGSVVVKVDSAIVSKTSGSILDLLADGAHTVRVEATDQAGNTGFAEVAFTVDTIAPTVAISSPVAGVTKNTSPLLTYTVDEGIVIVKVDGVVVPKISGDMLDALADGSHTVRVESNDTAGNLGFAEVTFVVDTVPPAISINQVTTPTNVNTQTVTGTRESGALVAVALNTSATAGAVSYPTDTTWNCAINRLVEGVNSVTVTATDASGNSAPAVTSIAYDSVAPTVVINSPSATNNNQPVLGYTASDGAVIVKVDGNIVHKVSGDTLDQLVDGVHAVRVESTDAAGNTGYAEVTFIVDTVPPTVTVDPVTSPTRVNTQTIGGNRENGAVITVSVDTSASVGLVVYPTDATWSSTVTDLVEGINNITITAKDDAQNITTITTSITYDSIAPAVTISSPVPGVTNNETPLLNYEITGGNVSAVSVDGVIVSKTAGQNLDPLADGSHAVRVGATDAAGNTGFAQVTFIVDTIPPSVGINPVTTPTNISSQTLTGTREENAMVSAVVNTSASVGAISYPSATTWGCTVSNLATGSNTVTVTATDAAGNPATAIATITFDGIAPTVSITSPGDAPTNDNTPLLTYNASDGSVVVKMDGAVVSNVSGDSLNTLPDGSHTVRVESTDAAGNTGFAQVTFIVDTAPPAISIDPVTTPTKISSQTIYGTRESGASVSVAANTSAAVGAVSYPSATTWSCTISNLVRGSNVITVQAVDAAGNSATVAATIKKT